ncbi:MAG: RNA polymerase sigma factor [Candidatus Zixiibacteriota bacterium]|nr:MAG: RNA polymerase sigma factor [candidate division Zixibacteria bacterium]
MRGDNQQQNRFYELLEPELSRLQAFCQKLVGDPEQGDDLVQDALYDAWKGFGGLRETGAFKSWLYRIVINRYRTNLRQFKKRAAQTEPLTNDVADDRQPSLQAARDRLYIAMAGLSAKDRTLVTLHELEGWSHSDLAKMFKSSAGAVRTRLTRCRHRMRKTLRRHLEKTNEGLSRTGVPKECVVVKQDRN